MFQMGIKTHMYICHKYPVIKTMCIAFNMLSLKHYLQGIYLKSQQFNN